eukprot:1196104-Prorocentrum_minimum.AAC.4
MVRARNKAGAVLQRQCVKSALRGVISDQKWERTARGTAGLGGRGRRQLAERPECVEHVEAPSVKPIGTTQKSKAE